MTIEIKKTPIKFGRANYIAGETEVGYVSSFTVRKIIYQEDTYTEDFPLLFSTEQLSTCLVMNLFLQQKYNGPSGSHFQVKNDVSLKTISSIANSLRVFLQWLDSNGRRWNENCERSNPMPGEWLPTYAFRSHLIREVKAKRLALTTANLYVGHIVQFYCWANEEGKIERLPVKLSKVHLQKKTSSSTSNLLFGFTSSHGSFQVQTHDLRIPKKYRAKTRAFDSDLCPYTNNELYQLINDPSVQNAPNKKIWVQLGYRCGLRAFEVASLNCDDFNAKAASHMHEVIITGKKGKLRKAYIPLDLFEQIRDFKNSAEQLKRRQKWEEIQLDEKAPLFINRSGQRINSASVSNLIYPVRRNLLEQGIRFKRNFHDLRSTFATGIAKHLILKGYDYGFICYKLTALLGHSDFETTKKYINLAKDVSGKPMLSEWEKDIFGNIEALLSASPSEGETPVENSE